MPVPDTNTFTLQDVVDEVNPSIESLTACFADAVDDYFDVIYKGDKDRLSNFRNYGYINVEVEIEESSVTSLYNEETGDHNGLDYADMWGESSCDVVQTDGWQGLQTTLTGNPNTSKLNAWRTVMSFDLSLLPSSGFTIISAELYFEIDSTYNSQVGSRIYRLDMSSPSWSVNHWDDVEDTTYLAMSGFERIFTTEESQVRMYSANGSELLSIGLDFGDELVLVWRHNGDWSEASSIGGPTTNSHCKLDTTIKPKLILRYTEP